MGISLDFIYLKVYGLLYWLHNYFMVVILEHYVFLGLLRCIKYFQIFMRFGKDFENK